MPGASTPSAVRMRLAACGAVTVVAAVLGVLLGAVPASAYWSAASTPESSGSARAATVAQGATPTATVSDRNTVALTWPATTLSTGTPVSGYAVTRFSQTGVAQAARGGCAGTLAAPSCTETAVPDGVWSYAITPRFSANWTGPASARSVPVRTDVTAPVNALSRTAVAGGSWLVGATLYYRGTDAGSFTLANALTDAGSGPVSSTSRGLTGTSTGWSHTPGVVSTPTGGPFRSGLFSWAARTVAQPAVEILGADALGNAASSTISFVLDDTPPTGGAIDYAAGRTDSDTFPVALDASSDSGAGIASSGARVLQQSVGRTNGNTCDSGGFVTVVVDPAVSPATQSVTLTRGNCYRFQYVVTDNVGNTTTTTSPNVVRARN
jgi:hypothetical protein